ncbi:MAG: agmatine deiminase family protein [Planctomycetota bacterium]
MSTLAQAVCMVAVVHLGFAALGAVLPAPSRALLDEQRGELREIVVHYVPGTDFAEVPYRDFFRQLPEEVRIWVLVEQREHAEHFERSFGRSADPVVVGKPITTWSRDRFASCEGRVLLPPEPHLGGLRRTNDWLAPIVLAKATGIEAVKAPFHFDGGDFCACAGRVLVSSAWRARNPDRSLEELLAMAESLFGQELLYLPDAPEHHIGMVLAPLGRKRILVGDVRQGRKLAPDGLVLNETEDIARRFDAVAERLRGEGFEVHRVPVLPTAQDFVWVSYTNAILADKVVYLPVYGFADLDRVAARVYRDLGFEVRPVDVSRTYPHGGALRCLVHVLARSP